MLGSPFIQSFFYFLSLLKPSFIEISNRHITYFSVLIIIDALHLFVSINKLKMILFLFIIDALLLCFIFLILFFLFKEEKMKRSSLQSLKEGLDFQNGKNYDLKNKVILSSEFLFINRKNVELISKEIYVLQKLFFKFLVKNID